ncbi:hypothetical protein I4U23_010734 [Adineta vaga]|nr:hypothetical protein I4U23_010734 [Adineta vaga]
MNYHASETLFRLKPLVELDPLVDSISVLKVICSAFTFDVTISKSERTIAKAFFCDPCLINISDFNEILSAYSPK